MTNIAFLDVSGVGNSGKSALVDLLREIDGFFVPHFQFEFDFLRVKGGLIDFRHALVEDWSPVRSHAALIEFLYVAHRMGINPRSWWDIRGWLDSTSQRYDAMFEGLFTTLTERFARSFIIGSYFAEWPYDALQSQPLLVLMRKIIRRLGGRSRLLRKVYLLDGDDFDARAQRYLTALYQSIVPTNYTAVVLNNGFEPFNPVPFLDMLNGSRQIVVTRDPRDIYVSGMNIHNVNAADRKNLAFDNDGLNKSFLATDDIELFVNRFRLYYKYVYSKMDSRVLHVKFENMVSCYETELSKILDFLKLPQNRHSRRNMYFDPELSRKNVGVWRNYSRQDEIRFIESQLGEYLVGNG
jgi:hypothetical protein